MFLKFLADAGKKSGKRKQKLPASIFFIVSKWPLFFISISGDDRKTAAYIVCGHNSKKTFFKKKSFSCARPKIRVKTGARQGGKVPGRRPPRGDAARGQRGAQKTPKGVRKRGVYQWFAQNRVHFSRKGGNLRGGSTPGRIKCAGYVDPVRPSPVAGGAVGPGRQPLFAKKVGKPKENQRVLRILRKRG